jgi:hypothetical protein
VTEFLLIHLDDEDLKCAGQIIKNVEEVQTPQSALKWALKQCAKNLKKTESPGSDSEPIYVTLIPPEVTPAPPEPDITMPLGHHSVKNLRFDMKTLANFEHTVVVGEDTLDWLSGKV